MSLKSFSFFLFGLLLLNCSGQKSEDTASQTPTGDAASQEITRWEAKLLLGPADLAIRMTTATNSEGQLEQVTFMNAEEEIVVKDIRTEGDSTVVQFPIFESALYFQGTENEMRGLWHNDARRSKNRIPFVAQAAGTEAIVTDEPAPLVDITGKWEVEFVYEGEETTPAIGYFEQNGQALTGTFQTETGDYRFLEGHMKGDSLYLSCFDGAHAFVFQAIFKDEEVLEGDFWSGMHWHETWTARRNPDFALSDPDSLTRMQPSESQLNFAFLNTAQQLVSTEDERYTGHPLVVQIMGTWCPNCKDETPFLNDLYNKYHEEGLEMIAIGFEITTDTSRALSNLSRMKDYFGIEYEVLFGGKAGKRTASAALPQLQHVMSYPTTIFMDRDHQVQRIYTGFSGPAVQGSYEKLTSSFEESVRQLLTSS